MSSPTTPGLGASDALARFVAGPHAGAAYDDAVRAARELLDELRNALQTPGRMPAIASRALASSGAPLRRAFKAAAALGATRSARRYAPIVAAAVVSGAIAKRGEAGVLEAVAVGREVGARLERSLTLDPPWDALAVIAGIAAAAAAARAAALDADATRHAIGLAATQAAGLGVTEGTPAAALACGKAAADAVEAATLARHGFTAASAPLEGRRGLAALMGSAFDETALLDDIGGRWFSV